MSNYSLVNDPTSFDIGKKQLMIIYRLVLLGSVTYKHNNKLLARKVATSKSINKVKTHTFSLAVHSVN